MRVEFVYEPPQELHGEKLVMERHTTEEGQVRRRTTATVRRLCVAGAFVASRHALEGCASHQSPGGGPAAAQLPHFSIACMASDSRAQRGCWPLDT